MVADESRRRGAGGDHNAVGDAMAIKVVVGAAVCWSRGLRRSADPRPTVLVSQDVFGAAYGMAHDARDSAIERWANIPRPFRAF